MLACVFVCLPVLKLLHVTLHPSGISRGSIMVVPLHKAEIRELDLQVGRGASTVRTPGRFAPAAKLFGAEPSASHVRHLWLVATVSQLPRVTFRSQAERAQHAQVSSASFQARSMLYQGQPGQLARL